MHMHDSCMKLSMICMKVQKKKLLKKQNLDFRFFGLL